MKASKLKHGGGGRENNRDISGHLYTLHERLLDAVNLVTRYEDGNGPHFELRTPDIEVQRLVLRSISAYLDAVSPDMLHHPIVKDSVNSMAAILVRILVYKHRAVLSIAANVIVKFLSILPNSLIKTYKLNLFEPLLSLLSSDQLEVAIPCATAENMILSNLTLREEKQACKMLEEENTVLCVAANIRNFSVETMPIDYFQGMASLLSTILCRWPQSRFPVCNDSVLMEVLEALLIKSDHSVKVTVLKLYSSLGLCGNAANKLLENGEALLQTMVQCMDSSYSLTFRVEGFKLAKCLATNEQGCLRMTSLCCQPLVKAIVCGLSRQSLGSGKISGDHMSFLLEACQLALITRWPGEHHIYFWNHGIDKVLLDLILVDFQIQQSQHVLSLEEQILMAQEGLNKNFLLVLRPYIWNILGWLATYCEQDFNPNVNGDELQTNMLITCACLDFVNSISKGHQVGENDASRGESAAWAVLMMVYSPCNYIVSKTKFVLSKILKPKGIHYLGHLLHSLNYISSEDNNGLSYINQTVTNLVGLICYVALPQYRGHVIKGEGMKIMLTFVRWCWSNYGNVKRRRLTPQLDNKFVKKTCCWVHAEDWEGDNVLLLYGLWALAELVHHSGSVRKNQDIFYGDINCKVSELVSMLQQICSDISTHGPRWFAAYVLSHLGFYGFPSKIGRRIGKALNEEEYADMQLILTNGETFSVHGIVLMIRCPALLPPDALHCNEKAPNNASVGDDADKIHGKFQKEVRLSAHVDSQALWRLLEFVYFGYFEAGDELVNKLKPLAKSCNLQPLLLLIYRKFPQWGTPIPSSDLAIGLGPVARRFSDIILEAKATELSSWTCNVCPLPVPHMHVHKIILWSSCEYMQALFQSGMQESRSQTIKVPVSWEAMTKLVEWFYTDQLPNLPSGCSWDHKGIAEKMYELQPYVELCWLADFWGLENVQDVCYKEIVSCLDSCKGLSIKIIQAAAEFSLWKLAEICAEYLAPEYSKLRDCGYLEPLDDFLVDMIRVASVRHSQESG